MAQSTAPDPDAPTRFFAEGEAALWLTESLMLALLEAKLLQPEAVLEAIDVVVQAKRASAEEGRSPEVSRLAAALLSSFSASIAAEANREIQKPAAPRPRAARKNRP